MPNLRLGNLSPGAASWDEPVIMISAVKVAKEREVSIITPMIGELVDLDKPAANRNWWEEVK